MGIYGEYYDFFIMVIQIKSSNKNPVKPKQKLSLIHTRAMQDYKTIIMYTQLRQGLSHDFSVRNHPLYHLAPRMSFFVAGEGGGF